MVCWQTGLQDTISLLFMTLLSIHAENLFSACGFTGTVSETEHLVLSCNISYCQKKKKIKMFLQEQSLMLFFYKLQVSFWVFPPTGIEQ